LPQLSLEVTEAASTELAPSPTALFTEDHAQERLVVWGRSEGGPNGKCWVWLLDPASQGEPIRQISGKQDCNYAVVTVNEKEYLASLPQWNPNVAEQPAEIVLYDVTRDGELVVYQTIPMGDVHLTSLMNTPQWGADGSVYLAGILDGKEQIFRYDSQTAAIEPYLDRDDGFSTSPLLSPDGRYLAYFEYTEEQVAESPAEGLRGTYPGTFVFYDTQTGEKCTDYPYSGLFSYEGSDSDAP